MGYPIRKKTEQAVRDRAGLPVQLLYNETDDQTVMQRGNTDGAAVVVGTTKICTNNSTVAQLDADAKFTGVAGDLNGYATILLTVFSDEDSATDGLKLFFSHIGDPYDWHEADAYTYTANSYKTYSFQPVDQYFKIEFTNGSGGTTTNFHITTRLHSSNVKGSSHRMADDIKGQDDAELVKAILAAEKAGVDDDVYTNIQATAAGNLKVSIEESDSSIYVTTRPYLYSVSHGDLVGHKGLAKFGMNDDVGATFETVWDGNAPYVWATAASTASIVSGSVEDDPDKGGSVAGTGAWTINISGLDANYDAINEDIALNGAGAVTTNASFIRVFRMTVLTAGTAGTNVGAITATVDSKSAAIITADYGQTLMALWTVPDDYTFYLVDWYANTSVVTKANETRIRVRPFGGAWNTKRTIHINGTGQTYDWKVPLVIAAKSDIEVQSKATDSGGDCASGFDGWYEL